MLNSLVKTALVLGAALNPVWSEDSPSDLLLNNYVDYLTTSDVVMSKNNISGNFYNADDTSYLFVPSANSNPSSSYLFSVNINLQTVRSKFLEPTRSGGYFVLDFYCKDANGNYNFAVPLYNEALILGWNSVNVNAHRDKNGSVSWFYDIPIEAQRMTYNFSVPIRTGFTYYFKPYVFEYSTEAGYYSHEWLSERVIPYNSTYMVDSLLTDFSNINEIEGFNYGYEAGYKTGYDAGVVVGMNKQNPINNAFALIKSGVNSISGFLNVQLFPGFTVGLLIAVPLIVSLLIVIIKFARSS